MKYLIRLDDASEYMDSEKWKRIEDLLSKYGIKPIVGIIPDNNDPNLVLRYDKIDDFWEMISRWCDNGWTPAMHGCNHEYISTSGGLNPVNLRSEFAGIPLEKQKVKIRKGGGVLSEHGIRPKVFFAPSHTFDENTLQALVEESDIRIISDTVATDVYKKGAFWFIPQQSGSVRKLRLPLVTFCYHPNVMSDSDFEVLESFIKTNRKYFVAFDDSLLKDRNMSLADHGVRAAYWGKIKFRRLLNSLSH